MPTSLPSPMTRILEGLMSLCMIQLAWRQCMPLSICHMMLLTVYRSRLDFWS